MSAASARASTGCRPRPDRSAFSRDCRAACAAHKIAEFALHNAATEWRLRRRGHGHHARGKRQSGFAALAFSLSVPPQSLAVPARRLPALFAGISRIASHSDSLPPDAEKISRETGKNTEMPMAGAGPAMARIGSAPAEDALSAAAGQTE